MSEPSDTAQLIDLRHLGRERVIGAWLLDDVIVDPGPSTCLDALLEGLGDTQPRALALTHVHLDHAGASGSLLRHFPALEVWVHERGAPHLVDPTRLLASAARLYGDDMQRLWGEVAPVPAEHIKALSGGERMGPLRVVYTPGHASHHVTYMHEDSGRAFSGDVTGVRIGAGYVLPPTPPPEVDLDAWRKSLDVLAGLEPHSLAITHFGAHLDVDEHLAAMRRQLDELERMASDLDEASFVAAVRARVAACDGDAAAAYDQIVPSALGYQGLVRYLRGRDRAA